ncbi:NAD(P)H-binding protein [Microbispora rosea]|uniref:SDR family oxidoreductase n=1 Tax=Microbispora rosea TaxID=58117 RepID=UPI003426CD9A
MILITGATGAVGRLVVQQLLAEGARVRAVSRSPHDAALPYGVEVVQGDPARPGTMAGHFAGVEAVFLHPRGLPESFVRALMARYDHYAGRDQHPPTGELDKVLGRPARTYADWVADHVAAFRNG